MQGPLAKDVVLNYLYKYSEMWHIYHSTDATQQKAMTG